MTGKMKGEEDVSRGRHKQAHKKRNYTHSNRCTKAHTRACTAASIHTHIVVAVREGAGLTGRPSTLAPLAADTQLLISERHTRCGGALDSLPTGEGKNTAGGGGRRREAGGGGRKREQKEKRASERVKE